MFKSIWTAIYQNNEIQIENSWIGGEKVFVNGKLLIESKKFRIRFITLEGELINSKNEMDAILVKLGGFFKIKCTVLINNREIQVIQIK